MQCAQPEWLILLIAVPLVWRMARRSFAGLSGWRARVAGAIRAMLVCLLVLALARLEWFGGRDAVGVIFALDGSDSIPSAPSSVRDGMRRYVAGALKDRAADDTAGLIYFAAAPSLEQPPSEEMSVGPMRSIVDPTATDIAGAMRLAAESFQEGLRKRLVLVTDGNENRGSALAEADALRARGIVVDVLPVRYLHENEIAVASLSLPERLRPKTPFRVRALIQSGQAAPVRLRLLRDNTELGSTETTLRPGRNAVAFTVPGEDAPEEFLKGLIPYRLEVIPLSAEADRAGGNNTAWAFASMDGPPQVLYLDGNAMEPGYQGSRLLAALLALHAAPGGGGLPGLRCDYRPIGQGEFPAPDALPRYDAIIIDNVAADDIGPERMQRINTLVRDFGTGLIMLGGRNAFGAGNYRNTPVEEALPVEMDLRHRKTIPNGGLMLVIDRSGSMEGDKLIQAKQAAREAVRALSPYDYIGIVAFDAAPEWLVPPTVANNPARLRAQIDTLGSAGGTDIPAAMREAYNGFLRIRAAYKHMIVLSDGQSPDTGIDELLAAMARAGISVSTIGIGEAEGQKLMESIAARGGGRYYFVQDPRKLPRIFVRETLMVKRGLIREETIVPELGVVPAFLESAFSGGVRPLHGYVASTAREQASVGLLAPGEDHDPILATWRYGLGVAVAFTSDVTARWGADWVGWDRFASLWSSILRETIRRDSYGRLSVRAEPRDGAVAVTVEAMDDRGNPESGLALTLAVTDTGDGRQQVPLRESGVGRYEAVLPELGASRHLLAVSGTGADGRPRTAFAGYARSADVEFERLEADLPFLHELARRGGGRVLGGHAPDDRIFRRDAPPSRDYRPLWPHLLTWAAVLFFIDVFFRRVMIDYAGVLRRILSLAPAGRRWAARWMPAPAAQAAMPGAGIPATARGANSASPAPDADRLFAGPAASDGAAASTAATPQADAPQDESSAFTTRLLDAKRRARKSMK